MAHIPTSAKPGKDVAQRRLSGVVLLVEDDPSVRAVTRRMLESRGLSVVSVESPEEAFQTVSTSKEHLDVLLTDVHMPEMTGPELAAKLHEIRPELGVVFISGYPREEAFAFASHDPAAEFLQKPFTPTQLIDVLSRFLTVDTPLPLSHNDTQILPGKGVPTPDKP